MSVEAPPFFIVGCERSGTTLLMLYLDQHPQIAIPHESHLFHRIFPLLPYYGNLDDDTNLRLLISDMLSDMWIQCWNLNVGVDEFISGLEERSFRGCVRRLFELFLQDEGKELWGEKTPVHVMYIPEILSVFQNAKFIHMVRDGRDVAQSLQRVPFGTKNVWASGKRWRNRIEQFESAKQYLAKDAYIEVRYEEFITRPQAELDRIHEFLGVEPISIAFNGVKSEKAQCFTGSMNVHYLVQAPLQKSRIGAYKAFFSPREIAIFESVSARELNRYHYYLETDGDEKPSIAEMAFYYAQGGFNRVCRLFTLNEFLFRSTWQLRLRGFFRSRRKQKI